jgi:hypothetical protein
VTALLACGLAAGPLFVATFLVEGATRPDYHPLRNSVSSFALGELGWVQSLDFVVAGLLTTAFAAGVRRALPPGRGSTRGPALIGLWALGLVVAGVFATDPASGYPPGTPLRPGHPSPHGVLHDLSVGFGFPALLAACLVFARQFAAGGERGWALFSVVCGLAFICSAFLAFRGFGHPDGLGPVGGLMERAAAVAAFTWLTALAAHLLAGPASSPDGGR